MDKLKLACLYPTVLHTFTGIDFQGGQSNFESDTQGDEMPFAPSAFVE